MDAKKLRESDALNIAPCFSTIVVACVSMCHCYFYLLCFYLTPEVRRLRKYVGEGVVAPAKPLWHLSHSLSLEKGQCQRVV